MRSNSSVGWRSGMTFCQPQCVASGRCRTTSDADVTRPCRGRLDAARSARRAFSPPASRPQPDSPVFHGVISPLKLKQWRVMGVPSSDTYETLGPGTLFAHPPRQWGHCRSGLNASCDDSAGQTLRARAWANGRFWDCSRSRRPERLMTRQSGPVFFSLTGSDL